ncbi:hypothetical protein BsWGS_13406 [Bradybaena similaris]
MTEGNIISLFSARVANTVTDTILSVTPDFVWDSPVHDFVQYLSQALSHADFHYQILVVLVTWLLLNLILIKAAWSIFGEDNTKLLSSVDHFRHLKKE